MPAERLRRGEDPMSLDGVNPREYVSDAEVVYYRDLYGDQLVHLIQGGGVRALCGKRRGVRPVDEGPATCMVCDQRRSQG